MACTTSSCLKCILNTLNTFILLGGAMLIGLATYSLGQAPTSYIIYLYVVGGSSFITALIGCCGICREHICMTKTYAVILLVLIILELLGKFGLSFNEDSIANYAAGEVEQKWNEELLHPGAMNTTQTIFNCCGQTGPDDYVSIGRLTLPTSCYPPNGWNQVPHVPYTKGCIQAAGEKFLEVFSLASGGEWFSMILSVLMCLAAFYLTTLFAKEQRRYNY